MKIKNIRNKKGFTLTEVLLTLGVAALIIISIFMIYPKVMSKVKVDREVKNITNIAANIESLYSSAPDYQGITTLSVWQAKGFPEGMTYPVKNSWGGDISIYDGGSGAYDIYYIAYKNIPSEECSKIAIALMKNFKTTLINNTQVYNDVDTGSPIASIAAACNAGLNSNSISFKGPGVNWLGNE